MKIERLFIYCLLAGTFLLASCSSEDMTDTPVETLSEGMYPLTFTATQDEVVAIPQTRVSDYDNNGVYSSKWTDGDQIKVTVSKGSNSVFTICKLNADGTVASYAPQLFWQTTDEYTINAWYSNISGKSNSTMTSSTVSLSDQSSGLAYAMKEEIKNAKYNTNNGNIALEFKHQLAKVRVRLMTGTTSADLTKAIVTIKNQYTNCSIDNTGTISSVGNANGTITMHKPTATDGYYEANIIPGTTLAADCIEITVGSNTVSATTTAITTTNAGEMYTFTITVDKPGPLQPDADGKFTINAGDDVTIKDYSGIAPIVVNGSATITLDDNVTINTSSTSAMTIADNAEVVLNIKGNNHQLVSSNGCGIKIGTNASIEIIGEGRDKSNLLVTGSRGYPAIGSGSFSSCKGIKIENLSLSAIGGQNRNSFDFSPATIGLGVPNYEFDYESQTCEYINIIKSKVTAKSKGGACIGTGSIGQTKATINEIVITDSELELTADQSQFGGKGACIGFGIVDTKNKQECEIKKIEITNTTFTNCTGYQIIGKGDENSLSYPTLKIGPPFTVNGTECKTYWNNANDHD